MNKKHILILMAHPRKSSLCNALAEEYKRGAEDSGAEVRFIQLIDLNLDLNFNSDIYRENNHIPSEVVRSCQDDLVWADHIVFIYPIWWGSYPALLKGYLDTVFMSRFAYKYKKFSKSF